MRASIRRVLTFAVLFSIAMGALSDGGWWWVWLALVILARRTARVRLLRLIRPVVRRLRAKGVAVYQRGRMSLKHKRSRGTPL
jgi:hypothetical protein